jgi:integrase
MANKFISGLAPSIESLVKLKHDLGYDYDTSAQHLVGFDQMCAEQFPGQTSLTRSMAMMWAQRRPGEHPNGLLRRITPVRQLGKHMAGLGEHSFLIPARLPGGRTRYVPHVFTRAEIKALFEAVDACQRPPCGGWRDLVMPAMFRFLYCLGMRPSEARLLTVNDVNPGTGKVFIRESKGHKDRIVFMDDQLAAYVDSYDQAITKSCPNRTPFFPNQRGHYYSPSTPAVWFHEFFDQLNLPRQARTASPPRLYDLRYPSLEGIQTFQ